MNVKLLLLLIIFLSVIVLCLHKKQKNIIILVVMFFCMIIGTVYVYFINTTFRDDVNIWLNKTKSHLYVVDNRTYYLPLPSKTTLKYRSSDKSAVYISKSNLDEIVTLYKNISKKNTFSKSDNENKIILLFEYDGYMFNIVVEMYGNSYKLIVDSDKGSDKGTVLLS